ncbi:hypothetical protein [Hyalangium minutum]|uniref:Choline-sulfatase n=1 Tax=Hyalangium minutum TaxID=394096 RepID=A0A085WFU9_9BACT|nr:hypothetical protein [Hyalangium minutum]KFE66562.1 Choline-sulfatase [Hyalangium minutum]
MVTDYAGDHFSRFDYGFQEVSAPDFRFPDLVRQRMLITHVALLPWTGLVPGWFKEQGEFPELTDPGPLWARVKRTLAGLPEDRPFALVVFASPTHFPYAAPWPVEVVGASDARGGAGAAVRRDGGSGGATGRGGAAPNVVATLRARLAAE